MKRVRYFVIAVARFLWDAEDSAAVPFAACERAGALHFLPFAYCIPCAPLRVRLSRAVRAATMDLLAFHPAIAAHRWIA